MINFQINGLPSPNSISLDEYDTEKVCDFQSERSMTALRYLSSNGADDLNIANDNSKFS